MRRLSPFAVCAMLAVAWLHAGVPAQQPQTFRAAVDLVQVDVSVLDKERHPVQGLTAADFTLLEDGKPRPIAAFSAVDLPGRPPTPGAPWMRDVPAGVTTNTVAQEGRLVVILMDRTIPDGFPTMNAREIARAAVRALGPGDLAAVVYTNGTGSQGFTSDQNLLLATIDREGAAGELSAEADEAWTGLLGGMENPVSNPGLGPVMFSTGCFCGVCEAEAVRRIAEAVRDVPRRRKILLFIGRDFQVETTESICIDPIRKAREAMFRSLDLASLTVHSLDPSGLETLGNSASWSMGRSGRNPATAVVGRMRQDLVRQGNISVLPDRTGGRVVLNTNNPVTRVPEIFAESDSYYLLGFQPAAADGRRHSLSVKVNRRGLDVRTRRGYLADPPSNASSSSDRAGDSAAAAAAGILPRRDGLSLAATVSPLRVPGTREAVVALALHVQGDEAPPATPPHDSERVEVVTGIFTTTGRSVGTLRQTLDVKPRGGEGGEVYDLLQRVPLRPGRYELRVGVRNADRDQSGSVYTFVDVPDFTRTSFALTDISLYTPPGIPAMAEGLEELLAAPPTARREFRRGDQATAFTRIYQAAPQRPVTVAARIVDEQNRRRYGQQVVIEAPEFRPYNQADYSVDLPIAELAPGAYLLTIEVRTDVASDRRDLRFSVQRPR